MKSTFVMLVVSLIAIVSFSTVSYGKKKASAKISNHKVQLKEVSMSNREGISFFFDDFHTPLFSGAVQEKIIDNALLKARRLAKSHTIFYTAEVSEVHHIDDINDLRENLALFYVEEKVTFYDSEEDMKRVSEDVLKPYILVHVENFNSSEYPIQFAFDLPNFPTELVSFIDDKINKVKISKKDKKDLANALDEFVALNAKSGIFMTPKVVVTGDIGESILRITMKVPGSELRVNDYYLDNLNNTLFGTEANAHTKDYSNPKDYYGILNRINENLTWVFKLEKEGVSSTQLVTGPLPRKTFDQMYANILKEFNSRVAQVPNV